MLAYKYWIGSGHGGNTSYTRASNEQGAMVNIALYWGADREGTFEEIMEGGDFFDGEEVWLVVRPISKAHYERASREAARRGVEEEYGGTFSLLTPDHF